MSSGPASGKFSVLQFWGAFAYNSYGPYHTCYKEIEEEAAPNAIKLAEENNDRKDAAILEQMPPLLD